MTDYYVRQSGGDDSNDGTSFALGWATIQHGLDNVAAGDTLYICADGTHTPSATLDVDTTSGSLGSPIKLKGANATGGDDGTVAVISGSSLDPNVDLVTIAASMTHYEVRNLRFTAATDSAVFETSNNSVNWLWVNCRFDNCGESGVEFESGAWVFVNCEFDSNTEYGANCHTSNRWSDVRWYGCSFHDNGSHGVDYQGNQNIYMNCLFYDNGGDGFYADRYPHELILANCVFYGNTGDGFGNSGISEVGNGMSGVFNCIFMANGAYGFSGNGYFAEPRFMDYNCFYNNTSGATDYASTPGSNNVTSDPQFTSVTDGSEDFTLQSGSPCIDNGIGALTS